MLDRLKKDKYLWGLVIIMFLAIFVRGWMFSDLLTFKMDQARDIKLLEEAYEVSNGKLSLKGLGELPLLGPRAAKTYLRLGPISYYFEYVSLLIFGDKPWAMAVPDLIFSILTIPLFYYFLRQVFNRRVSLMTTMLFASSFFLTQYGRFAWNPNSIPFWSLVYFLGLYKLVYSSQFTVHGDKFNNEVRPFPETIFLRKIVFSSRLNLLGRWLLVATVGYGVASQLHFTAMLAYPLVGILFIFFSAFVNNEDGDKITHSKNNFKFKIPKRYWLGAVVILGIMYLPMVLSEICTQGDNLVQFKYALSGRGKEEFGLYAKMVQSLKLHSEYFWFSLTSVSGGAGTLGVVGFVIIVGSLFVVFARGMLLEKAQGARNKIQINHKIQDVKYKQITKFKMRFKVIGQGKNSNYLFFLLIWIWFGVMFLLYTKLSFNVIKPRYWLLEAPVFFIWVALILEWASQHKKIVEKMVYFLISILVMMNLWAVGTWYWTLQNQQESRLSMWELKLKDENMIPWGQLQKSADYVEDISNQRKKDVCFYTTGEYRPVYNFIFEKRGLADKIRRVSFNKDGRDNCLFLAIDHRQRREIPRIPKDHQDEFEKAIDGKKEVGFITIWKIERKEQKINNKEQQIISSEYDKNAEDTQDDLVNLRNGFEIDSIVSVNNNDNKEFNFSKMEEKKFEKPKKVERVKWKDVFKCK